MCWLIRMACDRCAVREQSFFDSCDRKQRKSSSCSMLNLSSTQTKPWPNTCAGRCRSVSPSGRVLTSCETCAKLVFKQLLRERHSMLEDEGQNEIHSDVFAPRGTLRRALSQMNLVNDVSVAAMQRTQSSSNLNTILTSEDIEQLQNEINESICRTADKSRDSGYLTDCSTRTLMRGVVTSTNGNRPLPVSAACSRQQRTSKKGLGHTQSPTVNTRIRSPPVHRRSRIQGQHATCDKSGEEEVFSASSAPDAFGKRDTAKGGCTRLNKEISSDNQVESTLTFTTTKRSLSNARRKDNSMQHLRRGSEISFADGFDETSLAGVQVHVDGADRVLDDAVQLLRHLQSSDGRLNSNADIESRLHQCELALRALQLRMHSSTSDRVEAPRRRNSIKPQLHEHDHLVDELKASVESARAERRVALLQLCQKDGELVALRQQALREESRLCSALAERTAQLESVEVALAETRQLALVNSLVAEQRERKLRRSEDMMRRLHRSVRGLLHEAHCQGGGVVESWLERSTNVKHMLQLVQEAREMMPEPSKLTCANLVAFTNLQPQLTKSTATTVISDVRSASAATEDAAECTVTSAAGVLVGDDSFSSSTNSSSVVSAVSSLHSIDETHFRDGLQRLDEQIHRLQLTLRQNQSSGNADASVSLLPL